ncbi:UPF0313 protein [Dirofilaria immitis]
MVLYRRHIYQVSALSTFDGSLCAYHGCNGKAAGAQITQSQNEEVVTKNNETVLYEAGYRNGYNLNLLTRIYERASLVPAAAVIPALKVAEVERICWDPKDGELYLSRMKPEETLVEVRSDSDVQIDRLTLV